MAERMTFPQRGLDSTLEPLKPTPVRRDYSPLLCQPAAANAPSFSRLLGVMASS